MAIKKTTAILLATLALATVLVLIFSAQIQQTITPRVPDEKLASAIISQFPDLSNQGNPVFDIESVSRHDIWWYVVTIKSSSNISKPALVHLVILNTNDGLRVVSGPDTYTNKGVLIGTDLPDSVILELEKL